MYDIAYLKGKTLISISTEEYGGDIIEVRFHINNGETLGMFHSQDCCERVRLYDKEGEFDTLVGSPILLAEEVSAEWPEDISPLDASWTWTFYKLATIKGYVDMRWLGESNGYYSEEVHFSLESPPV
jgi:hypothetical protein